MKLKFSIFLSLCLLLAGPAFAEDGAWLGAEVDFVGDDARSLGLDRFDYPRVSVVEAGSPAEGAGLRAGDVIVAVDGEFLPVAALQAQLLEAQAGDVWQLTVSRDGLQGELSVALAARPERASSVTVSESPAREQREAAIKPTIGREATNNAGNSGSDARRDYVKEQFAIGPYFQETGPEQDMEWEGLYMRGKVFAAAPNKRHGFMLGLHYGAAIGAIGDERPALSEITFNMGYFVEPADALVIYAAGGLGYFDLSMPSGVPGDDSDFAPHLELGVSYGLTRSMAVDMDYRIETSDLIDQGILTLGFRFGPVTAGVRRYMDSEINQILVGFEF